VSIESSVRLNKYISDSGYCSRREADKLIDSNRVKVNGRRPELGTRVYADDLVTVDGQEVLGSAPSKSDRVYIVYNKPIGITCTTERSVKGHRVNLIEFILFTTSPSALPVRQSAALRAISLMRLTTINVFSPSVDWTSPRKV